MTIEKTYTKIGQFSNVIKFAASRKPPITKIIPYLGTIKLHGTNAGIWFDTTTREFRCLSRNRLLDITSDNYGFANFIHSIDRQIILDIFDYLAKHATTKRYLTIYGEWCGQGIQDGVAISQLPKRFVVFSGAAFNNADSSTSWFESDILKHISYPSLSIYNIYGLPTYTIDIDFANPALITNTLVDLTAQVEAQCPAGQAWGVTGTGEGIVWKPLRESEYTSDMWFKTKGQAHSVSKVKTLKEVDTELILQLNAFAEAVLLEPRLLQAIEFLKEMNLPISRQSTAEFLRWIINDIHTEETDTIKTNQYNLKQLNGLLSTRAREWFFSYINNQYVV